MCVYVSVHARVCVHVCVHVLITIDDITYVFMLALKIALSCILKYYNSLYCMAVTVSGDLQG